MRISKSAPHLITRNPSLFWGHWLGLFSVFLGYCMVLTPFVLGLIYLDSDISQSDPVTYHSIWWSIRSIFLSVGYPVVIASCLLSLVAIYATTRNSAGVQADKPSTSLLLELAIVGVIAGSAIGFLFYRATLA